MTWSKRHSFRRIALGVAVAAIIPATAHARPLDVNGIDARLIHEQAAPVDKATVVGAEDLAFSRHRESTATVVRADGNSSYDAGVGSVGGLVLILAAAGAAVAVRHSRKGRGGNELSPTSPTSPSLSSV
jgi:hypothetical protein